jgi:hypothetical protein
MIRESCTYSRWLPSLWRTVEAAKSTIGETRWISDVGVKVKGSSNLPLSNLALALLDHRV